MKLLILLTVISTIQSFSFLKTTPSPPHQHSTSSRPSKNVLHSTPTAQSSKTPTLSSLIALSLLLSPLTAHADGDTKTFKLPPIDRSQPSSTRCVLKSSAIGQSNAARDSLFDLRECSLSGSNAKGMDLSGVILENTDLSNTDFTDAIISKGYLHTTNFKNSDFTNAVIDRGSFKGSDLSQASFKNTVLTGTNFDDANVEGADFTESAIGDFDARRLCKNPTLKGVNEKTGVDTRESAGC